MNTQKELCKALFFDYLQEPISPKWTDLLRTRSNEMKKIQYVLWLIYWDDKRVLGFKKLYFLMFIMDFIRYFINANKFTKRLILTKIIICAYSILLFVDWKLSLIIRKWFWYINFDICFSLSQVWSSLKILSIFDTRWLDILRSIFEMKNNWYKRLHWLNKILKIWSYFFLKINDCLIIHKRSILYQQWTIEKVVR